MGGAEDPFYSEERGRSREGLDDLNQLRGKKLFVLVWAMGKRSRVLKMSAKKKKVEKKGGVQLEKVWKSLN